MKTLILIRHTVLSLLVLLVPLVSCSAPAAPTLSPTSTLAPSPTFAPSPTAVPSLTPTWLPTDTPTPSPIPPTRTPSPTPVPTMTADEEYVFVSEMLQDNGGCRLPCWWGFTPGETPQQTPRAFFTSLGKQIQGSVRNYTVVFNNPGHYESYQSYIGDGILDMIGINAGPPVGQDGYPAYGDHQFGGDWRTYMLPQMLEVYGPPQQVFLETYSSGPDRLPFRLWLFYPDQSFLVKYEGFTGEEGKGGWVEAGQAIRMCPWRSEVALWLWPPEREMTLEDIDPMIRNPVDPDRIRSLEEATGISIEQFYQTFSQPDNQACLETPADLW